MLCNTQKSLRATTKDGRAHKGTGYSCQACRAIIRKEVPATTEHKKACPNKAKYMAKKGKRKNGDTATETGEDAALDKQQRTLGSYPTYEPTVSRIGQTNAAMQKERE